MAASAALPPRHPPLKIGLDDSDFAPFSPEQREAINLFAFYKRVSEKFDTDQQLEFRGEKLVDLGNKIRLWLNSNFCYEITHLDLSWVHLTHLPDEIRLFSGLRELNLSHTRISHLPNALLFPQLETLRVSHTHLTQLPKRLYTPNLVEFDASHTPLETLPENWETGDTHVPELDWFPAIAPEPSVDEPIYWTRKKQEPISVLSSLRVFNLSHTKIPALPKRFNPPKLKYLFLAHTPIAALPENLSRRRIKHLDITGTPLEEKRNAKTQSRQDAKENI